jgi:hypothetical protein
VLHIDVKNDTLNEDIPEMPKGEYLTRYHTDAEFCCNENIKRLKNTVITGDSLPMTVPNMGTVTLAAYLGAEPHFAEDTVWYNPNISNPENYPVLKFDVDSRSL